MYDLLAKLMLVAAMAELGIFASEFRDCKGRACLARFEKASREILNVDWQPIRVFPNEARRFEPPNVRPKKNVVKYDNKRYH